MDERKLTWRERFWPPIPTGRPRRLPGQPMEEYLSRLSEFHGARAYVYGRRRNTCMALVMVCLALWLAFSLVRMVLVIFA